MAAHDYWRVSFLDSQHGGYPACADIEFRPVPGVAVTPSGGTPSISSILFGAPGDVFDGNPATGVVLGTYTGWMEYAYAAGTGPDCQELMLQANANYYHNEGPKNITVDYSDDGVTWTVYQAINCGGDWASNETRIFPVGVAPTPPVVRVYQMPLVMVASDIPQIAGQCQVTSLPLIFVNKELPVLNSYVAVSLRTPWAFPLLIQKGI